MAGRNVWLHDKQLNGPFSHDETLVFYFVCLLFCNWFPFGFSSQCFCVFKNNRFSLKYSQNWFKVQPELVWSTARTGLKFSQNWFEVQPELVWSKHLAYTQIQSAASPALKKWGGPTNFYLQSFLTNNSLRKLNIMISWFIKCSVGKNKIPYDKIPFKNVK